MKGFVVTPILFAGIFLVAGLMMLNFMAFDTRMKDSVSLESRMRNLHSSFMENKTSAEVALLFHSARAATQSGNISELQANIEASMGPRITVWGCDSGSFMVNYTGLFRLLDDDMGINRTYTVTREITCPLILEIEQENATIDCEDGLNIMDCY